MYMADITLLPQAAWHISCWNGARRAIPDGMAKEKEVAGNGNNQWT